MNSSDLSISSDWDIIDNEMSQLVSNNKAPEVATSEDLEENAPKGSCIDEIPEQKVKDMQEDANIAGVLDVISSETNTHNESSSSSEFDVLDETVEDNQSNMYISNMEYSMSSSLESSHPSLVVEAEDAENEPNPTDETPRSAQEFSINVHPYLVAIALSLAFIAILFASAPFGSIQQMRERMSALKTENDKLKNLVQSKFENDNLLMGLEEQIKSLKDENFKLSESMKALLNQLEEQSIYIWKKSKEGEVQDSYRIEIETLKEKINILQIDNEELQKQLVRTRYSFYSPHQKERKANPSLEDKEPQDTADNKEDRDNSSEILMEEINELRKKLDTEVEKLQSWKDSVYHLVKMLKTSDAESSAENKEENLKGKKASSEEPKTDKDRKSDWSWGGVKKNLRDTFEGLQDIDVPNMISNYVDREKIEKVFHSVSHYFKKAQEKTKKVLNFNHDVNKEMWSFFGQLRNQWHDVTDKYFQKNYPPNQTPPQTEDYRPQNHEHKPKPYKPHKSDKYGFDAEKKFDKNEEETNLKRYQPHKSDKLGFDAEKKIDKNEEETKPKESSNENNDKHIHPDLENFIAAFTEATLELEKMMAIGNQAIDEDNSWVFKRAAHRSQLRAEEQEAFTNWFLKRGRDFHYDEEESLKEWFKESYQNLYSDEENKLSYDEENELSYDKEELS